MGCCLSSGRGNINARDGNASEFSNDRNPEGRHHQHNRQTTGPRLPMGATQSTVLSTQRTPHRFSRHLEREAQREEEQTGLRLDERLSRPLVRHTWTARTPMTREQLLRSREEYFDTRVTGRAEIWGILKLVIETMESGDLASAQEMLNASGINVPTGNLVHGAYDELGHRYDLPDYCISEPRNLIVTSPETEKQTAIIGQTVNSENEAREEDDIEEKERKREEKGKRVINQNVKKYRVIARLSNRGGPAGDIPITFEEDESVRQIIHRILEKGSIDQQEYKVKIAYLGKILHEHQTLPNQGWVQGHVINALVLRNI